jgi:hypothetical protein
VRRVSVNESIICKKGETMEIGISGVNGALTILPPQNGGMRVADKIARDSGASAKTSAAAGR